MNNINVESNCKKSYLNFDDMDLKSELKKGIYAYGWEKPSKIQEVGIVPVLEKNDCIIQAQSGTGKTGTFSIACLQVVNESINECQVICLSPTREIAEQSLNVIKELNKFMNIKISGVIGGKKLDNSEVRNSSVVVGTPGRIYDLLKKNVISTNNLKLFIIDEADIMLQKGFREQVSFILQYSPDDCQFAIYTFF